MDGKFKNHCHEQEAQLIETFRANSEFFDLVSEVVEIYQDDPRECRHEILSHNARHRI